MMWALWLFLQVALPAGVPDTAMAYRRLRIFGRESVLRRGHLLAEAIHEQFQAIFPDERWRGIKEEEFGVLVMTTMPAVLIEMGFIDCSTAARLMIQGKPRRDMAEAIARGIAEYAEKRAHKIQ